MRKRYYILKGLYEIEDTFVAIKTIGESTEWENDNFYLSPMLACSTQNRSESIYVFYRRHTILKIPCKTFEAEKIELTLYISGGTIQTQPIRIYECLDEVDLKTVTWNTRPQNLNFVKEKYVNPTTDEAVTFDITDSMQRFFNDYEKTPCYYLKHGWEWKQETDAFDVQFFSTEETVEELRPKLNITFL